MGILALAADERVADVNVTEDELSVRLMDGRTITVPLAWFPRLLKATEEQRRNWRISGGGYGIHWEDIDEDLSVEGLLRGAPAPLRPHLSVELTSKRKENPDVKVRPVGTHSNVEEDDNGLLDHLADVEEAGNEMTAVMVRINDEIVTVGEKMNQQTARINQLKKMGRAAKAGDYKKITLLAASDLDTFSKRVEGVLPNFEKAIRKVDAAYTGYVSLANPSSPDDVEQIRTILKSLSELLEAIRPAKESMRGFRDSGSELGAMNLSKALTAAAKRQAMAVEGVIRNMGEVESFALRLNFQINEKFGDMSGG